MKIYSGRESTQSTETKAVMDVEIKNKKNRGEKVLYQLPNPLLPFFTIHLLRCHQVSVFHSQHPIIHHTVSGLAAQ